VQQTKYNKATTVNKHGDGHRAERQSAQMSKITNDGLTGSGTGCFIPMYPYGNTERQRVNFVVDNCDKVESKSATVWSVDEHSEYRPRVDHS